MEDYYNQITEIQAKWNESWRDKKRWIIVEEDDSTYSIHEHTKDGVAPPCVKPDKRSIVSRFLQLLQISPVAPQTYPEEICVGRFEYKSADILQMPIKEQCR